MNKLKLVAGVILIFLVGALTGALGTGLYFSNRIDRFGPGGPPPRLRTSMVVERMTEDLGLTETQRREIERIVEQSESRIMAIRRTYLPEIKEVMDQSFELMKTKLDAEQKNKLESLKQRVGRRHARAFINSITPELPEQTISTLRERLSLTKSQAARLRPIIEENYRELERIIEKYRRKTNPEVSCLRQEVRNLRINTENRLKGIFSAEQLREYRRIEKRERIERRLETGNRSMGTVD